MATKIRKVEFKGQSVIINLTEPFPASWTDAKNNPSRHWADATGTLGGVSIKLVVAKEKSTAFKAVLEPTLKEELGSLSKRELLEKLVAATTRK